MALANLVESPAGMLWLGTKERVPACGTLEYAGDDAVEPANGPLPQFLQRTGWVVSLQEYASDAGAVSRI